VREYFRPNLWPNTPDILHEYLQHGGRPAFIVRLVLAATLGASYGIYGPAFELCLNQPREPASEEYVDSEKYEVHHWDLDDPISLRHIIGRVNQIRRDNAALQWNEGLRVHATDSEALIAYSKSRDDGDTILTIVNLDPRNAQAGWVELPLADWGVDPHEAFHVHDLLGDERYTWSGAWNYVRLDPTVVPAHIFRIERRRNAAGGSGNNT
jgi:starch synthase (maltosyl-transferring)